MQLKLSIVKLFLLVIISVFIIIPTTNANQAEDILDAMDVKGGLVVHVGCGDGNLTADLKINDSYIVHGLDTDVKNVEDARKYISSLGIYGEVSVDHLKGEKLPYIDNMVNLVVSEKLGNIPMDEVMRVLCPNGVAYIKDGDEWVKKVKPRPEEIDEWTHYLHDTDGNPVAQDSVVGPPRHLQWVGSPRWSRHHDHMASMSALVSSNGRIFYIMDEGSTASIVLPSDWKVIARDAFNGTILWKRSIDKWHTHLWPLKSGPAQLPRRLVSIGDIVYVTLGIDAPLSALDAATGETIRTYDGTRATEEILYKDGILYLLVNENPEKEEKKYSGVQVIRKDARETAWDAPPRKVMAVNAFTGEKVWEIDQTVVPLTMATDGKGLYMHDGEKVISLNPQNGDLNWESKPLMRWATIRTYFAPTLVVKDGVVIFAGGENMVPHRGGKDTMTALSAETGKELWTAPHPPGGYQSPEDVIIAGGLVWAGATTGGGYSGIFTGRNIKTGELENEFPPDVDTHWFHHRCYRAKATEQYLLTSRTGIEFLDIDQNHWICHHWVRGGCLYGIMPCNGLIYAPPHDCACYIEAKQFGLNALAPESESRKIPAEVSDEGRLKQGPAYGVFIEAVSGNSYDWPTYRQNITRSASTEASVSEKVKESWETEMGTNLTSLTVADGRIYVASIDTHTVYALDEKSGEVLWSYMAGGRVDSPPTIHKGRVFFGSADGYVYSLRAIDGELIWRFRAAPVDRRLMSFEQLESVWPVHGSVMIRDDALYFVAGRSMFIDGGLRLFKLDPVTGKKLVEKVMDDKDPKTGENLQVYVDTLNMTVALPDILSSDGDNIYMRSMPIDFQGTRKKLAYTNANQQKSNYVHLFAPTGFLDGSWWHRSYWVYGTSMASGYGGYYQAGKYAPAGRIIVADDENIYGFGRKPQYYRWTTPMEYHLFAASREIPEPKFQESRNSGSCVRVAKSASLNPANKPVTVEAWVMPGNLNGAIISRGGPSHGYCLYLKDGVPHFSIRSDGTVRTVYSRLYVTPGKWVHLAGVLIDEDRMNLYVNGTLVKKVMDDISQTGMIVSDPAQAMEIGADEGGAIGSDYQSPYGFTGLVDEVKIYHKAFTSDEIREHYNNPESKPSENDKIVLYYTFDDENAKDASGNNNHGKVEKGVYVDGKVGKAIKFSGEEKKTTQISNQYAVEHKWTHELPLHVRSMVLADDKIFIAGPPDLVNEDEAQNLLDDPEVQALLVEQEKSLEGKKGATLMVISKTDGEKLAEYKLDSVPEWDGMVAANGCLYFSTMDGKVVCFEALEIENAEN
ncbi:PQQ-binding-like beta-propeller repeat protein [Candidatus Poribacteria bacterium]|nr:PQQ-binding-like beta-propeller repeat protein [Candidatus Poribacteria bacterium]